MEQKDDDDPKKDEGCGAEGAQVSHQVPPDKLDDIGESGYLDMEVVGLHDGNEVFDPGDQVFADLFIDDDDDVGGRFIFRDQETFPEMALGGVPGIARAVGDALDAGDGVKVHQQVT